MEIKYMKDEVFKYYSMAYHSRLMTGTSGNISLFSRENGVIAITPSSVVLEKMTSDDIVIMDIEGNVISGGRPSSEWRMHCAVYKALGDVSAVVHTHSRSATAFAVCAMAIPEILVEARLFLKGDVPVCPYAPAGSRELGEYAAKALKDRGACLLQNHGVAAAGKDLEEAYIRALYTEETADMYLRAKLIGSPAALPE